MAFEPKFKKILGPTVGNKRRWLIKRKRIEYTLIMFALGYNFIPYSFPEFSRSTSMSLPAGYSMDKRNSSSKGYKLLLLPTAKFNY